MPKRRRPNGVPERKHKNKSMLRRLLFCISLDLHYLCPYIKQGNTRYDGHENHAIHPGTSTTAGHDTCATPESQYDAPYGNALKSAYSIQPTPLMNLTRKLFLFFALAGTLCLPSSAQERAKPRNGEGVSTFLYRFGYTSRAAEKRIQANQQRKIHQRRRTDSGTQLPVAHIAKRNSKRKRPTPKFQRQHHRTALRTKPAESESAVARTGRRLPLSGERTRRTRPGSHRQSGQEGIA